MASSSHPVLWLVREEDTARLAAYCPRLSAEESDILSRVSHPRLLAVLERTDSGAVLELAAGGSLLRLCHQAPLEEPRVLSVLRDTLEGLEALESEGFVHGNLHPGNVLLDADGRVKLAGVGSHSVQEQPARRGRPVLPWGPETAGAPTEADDSRALGALAWFMLTMSAPAPEAERAPLPAVAEVSPRLVAVIEKALSADPSLRPDLREWRRALRRLGPSEPPPLNVMYVPEARQELMTQPLQLDALSGGKSPSSSSPSGGLRPLQMTSRMRRRAERQEARRRRLWAVSGAVVLLAAVLTLTAVWKQAGPAGRGVTASQNSPASASVASSAEPSATGSGRQAPAPAPSGSSSPTGESPAPSSSPGAKTAAPESKKKPDGSVTESEARTALTAILQARVKALSAGKADEFLAVSDPGSQAREVDDEVAAGVERYGGLVGLTAETAIERIEVLQSKGETPASLKAWVSVSYSPYSVSGTPYAAGEERVLVEAVRKPDGWKFTSYRRTTG